MGSAWRWLASMSCLLGGLVLAAEPPVQQHTAPTVQALSIDVAEAPLIDGDIGDAVWSRAQRIERFTQMEPRPLSEPTERTEAWIVHDRDRLYIAVHAHDSHPQQLTVTTMERDAVLRDDDVIRVILDPRQTRRDGYFFELNPAGARTDALLANGGQGTRPIDKWNMVWAGRSRRVADGWTAEFALPFRGLAYDAGSDTWGLDLVRQVKRLNEVERWAPTPAGTPVMDLSYAGRMNGMTGMTQGRGLDVLAYAQARATRDWPGERTVVTGRPSATAYYRFTPALTGLLTLNTDFTDKPLDSRQVNTTRFSLFEPETREFFLEDAAAFEFGTFGDGPGANGRPFFSRNIGLVDGRAVNLDVGAKLSGSIGGLRVGALSVRTGADARNDAQGLSVLRLSHDVLDESRIGMIATSGDPTGRTRNDVAGVDFQYRNSHAFGNQRLNLNSYVERSHSSVRGDDYSFGTELTLPNEPWNITGKVRQIGRDFAPALGFVNRPGVRSYYGEVDRIERPRQGPLQKLTVQAVLWTIDDLDGRVQSRDDWLSLALVSRNNDQVMVAVDNYVERLDAPFALPGGVVVPAGRHEFVRWTADLQTAQSRRFSLHWKLICCDYYDGRSTESDLQLGWHPSARFNATFRHQLQPITLPTGHTSIHIESLLATVNVSPDMKLASELQYDNVSRRFAASLRYRWEFQPTSELLVTLGESAALQGEVPHGIYHSQATAIAVRLGHRFQY